LAKVGLRGCFNAVTAGAEINPVHIKLEDLLFREFVLDPKRDHRFEQLATDVAAAERETVAGELLGNAARTFLGRAGQNIADERAENPAPINAGMLIKTRIFARQERIDEKRRNFIERNT